MSATNPPGTSESANPRPTEIRVRRAEKRLDIAFDDGTRFELPAELLRVESPSAEVKGHGVGQKKIVPGKRMVSIREVEPVGRYAIRILFDDGHDTGLFSWPYLYELGRNRDTRWQVYLDALAERGWSRDA